MHIIIFIIFYILSLDVIKMFFVMRQITNISEILKHCKCIYILMHVIYNDVRLSEVG